MSSFVGGANHPSVVVVVTSCRRFDLLEITLKNFIEYNDYPIREVIVIEDSDDAGVHQVCSVLSGVKHRVIVNGENIGQIRSIDKAYAEIDADYIFHMEDDWLFTRSGVIASLVRVLELERNAVIACARSGADMPRYVRSLATQAVDGVEYKRLFPELHHLWHTFTFNPGLRRVGDYRELVGGYQSIGDEAAISRRYKAQKRDMLWLVNGGVKHIGVDGRSTYGKGAGFGRSRLAGRVRRIGSLNNLNKWRRSFGRWFWHILRLVGLDTENLQRRKLL